MQQTDQYIDRYLTARDTADRQQSGVTEMKSTRRKEKIATLKKDMVELREIKVQLKASPSGQVSLTDPDARAMATSTSRGMVGYNVQKAVETQHQLIVAHEVTNIGTDRLQLSRMAKQAKAAMESDELNVLADQGYYSGDEILACDEAGITAWVSKPMTSSAKAEGRFDKEDFIYDPKADQYLCPGGSRLIRHSTSVDKGHLIYRYRSPDCPRCPIKEKCTPGKEQRVSRWEHEATLERMQRRLDMRPEAIRIQRQTVEHPFGTIKYWIDARHFLTRTLDRVSTEMSLHVLAYNMKRVMQIMGVNGMIAAK
jgi:hypothetical protein